MAQPEYVTSPMEDWQHLVAWDGELYDPLYTSFTDPQGDSLPLDYPFSTSLEQPYFTSAPPSLADGIPSLDVSAPPSVLDGSSSFGPVYSTSPFFDTNTTSPLLEADYDRYFGSFDGCENNSLPFGSPHDSPILDTRLERIVDTLPNSSFFDTTTGDLLNPHVAGSSHSFSGLDVRASQVFGTWTDRPQIVEPIAEADENNTDAIPIPIPNSYTQSSNNSFTSYARSAGVEQQERSRAVTIPQSNRRPSSYNAAVSQSPWAHRVPSVLSVSPSAHRRPRSTTLSRSTSRTESRRKLATPSPTSEGFGWVSYHLNSQTNRLAATSTDGGHGRTPRGRKKGLTAEQRSQAALMRIIGACTNCKTRKEKCDPGTPCKSCLEHYKGDLINHPCRDRLLSDQSNAFLSDKWHPTARPIGSFLAPNSYNLLPGIYKIPICFGFGPSLSVPVHAMLIQDDRTLVHEHVSYTWPPSSTGSTHNNAVLPAVLTKGAMVNLTQTLDSHLSLLVSHHFRQFPLFCSPLRTLRDVYVFFRSLPSSSPRYRILQQALKLLVLVHIGGDITLPPPSSDLALSQLVQATMEMPNNLTPTPCFIRAQFGRVMPDLALGLMKEVLSSLEQLLLNRDCEEWPMALAVTITLLMTIESINYHGAKLPYHDYFDPPQASEGNDCQGPDEDSVNTLLAFYTACFSGCHARLRPDWEGEAASSQGMSSPEDIFIQNVRGSIRRASGDGYLSRKATETTRQGDDMEYFFDRLVARLLLSKT